MEKESKAAASALRLFCVILDWNPDNAEEGDYSDSVWAKDEDEAIALIAEEMADSGEEEFDTEAKRQEFIDGIIAGAGLYAATLVANDLPRSIEMLLAGPSSEMTPRAKKDYAKVMGILAKYGVPT